MDLSPGQRKAAFAVIVAALAGLAVFLLVPGSPSAGTRPGPQGPPGRPPASAAAPTPASSAAAISPPPGGAVDIYHLLPFTQAGLDAAAAVVRSFATDYATYAYSESAASYVGRMKGLVTAELAARLARGYATPGVAQLRAQQKRSAVGSGRITALRAYGPSSLIFLVAITQKTSSSQGASTLTTGYAVTVTGAGTSWQVSDIELATAGNS
jgi:hypothetical protein